MPGKKRSLSSSRLALLQSQGVRAWLSTPNTDTPPYTIYPVILPCLALLTLRLISSVQPLSRVRSLQPMNRSMPGLPVHHQLPEFTQTHIHRVSDAILPSHPLSSPSPPAPNLPSIRVFSKESTLRMSGQSIGVSALASFLPKKSQG